VAAEGAEDAEEVAGERPEEQGAAQVPDLADEERCSELEESDVQDTASEDSKQAPEEEGDEAPAAAAPGKGRGKGQGRGRDGGKGRGRGRGRGRGAAAPDAEGASTNPTYRLVTDMLRRF